MSEDVQRFMVNLVKHFYNRMDVYYMLASRVKQLENIEKDIECMRKLVDIKQQLSNYVATNDTINYYDIFKDYIENLDETDSEQAIKLFKAYEDKKERYIDKEIREYFKNNGYSLHLDSDIMSKLSSFYNRDKMGDISDLPNDAYYLVDNRVFNETSLKPILFTEQSMSQFRMEKANQQFYVLPNILSVYFDYLVVTKRGIESEKRVNDSLLEVAYYKNVTNYAELHPYTSRDATLQKLREEGVDPALPFIELIIDDFGEYYINNHRLERERDIIDFVNRGYYAEELDREVKSLDRKEILQTVLQKNPKIYSNFTYECPQALSKK